MDYKKELNVIAGHKQFKFTFLQPPSIGNFIENGEDFYEIMNIKHKAAVTRKPDEDEYEKIAKETGNQFHVELIEVEPAEVIVYAKQHKKV